MNRQIRLKEWKRFIGSFVLMFSAFTAWAQVPVTGTVTDESGLEVIGANVKEKGTSNGAITDVNGTFRLQVNNPQKAVLQVSFIGYETQEVRLNGQKNISIVLKEIANELQEVTVVAYGTQKKETLTGAISALNNEALVRSPNASVANTLAGQITGLSSVQTSGQPGKEDPRVFIRGVGSLTEGASSPLILVDGVERSFFQMDPNEIETVTVLKDASATAVFGVRGANGVILVTTRRGKEGKAKISVNSSVGMQMPTRMLEMADSYTYATLRNEIITNDKPNASEEDMVFDKYAIERFRLNDEPLLYPSIDWRRFLLKRASVQTQHNVNISGGTKDVRYFVSLGFLFQNGLLKQFKGLDYDNNYKYKRYNYRANLDFNATKTTTLKIGIGGIVGNRNEPIIGDAVNSIWTLINQTTPFSSPGVIDGQLIVTPEERFHNKINLGNSALPKVYGTGYSTAIQNTMNLDLLLNQKLDFITQGLSMEVKGAYNTGYGFTKQRKGEVEQHLPFYRSSLENPALGYDSPDFNKEVVYKIKGANRNLQYDEHTSRSRNWYLEASLRYKRKWSSHNVGGLLLYNQSKKYYPSQWVGVPSAYVGFVGRLTYDYKSRYMAEFNFGYNGSENFAPGKRFGAFPAGSVGYILSEEAFMKKQKVVDYLKLRASVGLVGNDNLGSNRFLFLPDSYDVNLGGVDGWNNNKHGFNFGYNSKALILGALEKRLGNPGVTWETALKQNYGVDAHFLKSRLKLSLDYFREERKDILINRKTIPLLTGLTAGVLPAVNMGKVKNQGYEIEVKWNDKIREVGYHINGNVSYSKNKIVFQDEVEPNEPYMWRTGHPVGTLFGYVADGFYGEKDFRQDGSLIDGLPDPGVPVKPGDVKYRDLNNDEKITSDDQTVIGHPIRPAYTFGLNYGVNYKGFFLTMNWTATAERSLLLNGAFREPFGNGKIRGLMKFHADTRWTPETAQTANTPRFTETNAVYNMRASSLWVRDASYLKLKNMTVGYNFTDKKLLKKLGIRQLGIQLTGYNLLTFDKFDIMDPEARPDDADSYPIIKIYNVGINLTF